MNRSDYLLYGKATCHPRGNDLPQAKLDTAKVRWIRANSRLTARAMAQELGVHYRTIEKVRHFQTWGHV